jgi:hypothetical protein
MTDSFRLTYQAGESLPIIGLCYGGETYGRLEVVCRK